MMKKCIVLLLIGLLALGCAGAETAEIPEPVETPEGIEEAATDEASDLTPEEAVAPSASQDVFRLWFEEGFGLEIPEGWVSYPVDEVDRRSGLRYLLGDGNGGKYLYIQILPSKEEDIVALNKAVEAGETLTKTADLTFDGVPFVAFIDEAKDASCCIASLKGQRLIFAFAPHSDAEFMMTATRIMESFEQAK